MLTDALCARLRELTVIYDRRAPVVAKKAE
jgi:hypothetical protein